MVVAAHSDALNVTFSSVIKAVHEKTFLEVFFFAFRPFDSKSVYANGLIH